MSLLDESRGKFDFVLLDLNLPKFHGFAVFEQRLKLGGMPVVVLTGSDNPQDRERAMQLGVRDYVVKPQGFEPFMSAVHRLLERWIGSSSAGA